ncbi:MAG: carboxypeptidase-like regulatory domain-containing protein [Chitinophagaceae bacterium]
MAKNLQVTIAEPCHENWESMTPSAKGKFCGACRKQVIDFTGMSDSQVMAVFKKAPVGSVCGRFMDDQLDRNMMIPKKRVPWVKYFFQLTLPLFLSSLRSNAQMGKPTFRQADTLHVDKKNTPVPPTGYSLPGTIPIKGKVIDEEGKPISYTSVIIKGTKNGMSADSSGLFALIAPQSDMIILIVSHIGFMSKEIVISKNDIENQEELTIQLTKLVLTAVEVTSTGRTSIMGGAMTLSRITFLKEICEVPPLPELKMYPNPIAAGATLTIDCRKLGEDKYSFQLLTISGQVVMQTDLSVSKGLRSLSVSLPHTAPGSYIVRMMPLTTNKSINGKILIQ